MEGSVWQLFVQVAISLLNQSKSLTSQKQQNSGTASPNVPENVADSTSTSANATGRLRVKRNLERMVNGGVAGVMEFNGEQICFTLENPADLIQPGIYTARLDKSPRLGYVCPHLRVPERDAVADGDAGLRVHVANYISQLEGCVAVGLQPRPDCIEQSQAAFDKLMAVLPQTFDVEIC